MINVTKTFFPPIEEYQKQLERVWKNEWLTNRGELVQELEVDLKKYLGASSVICMNNGTIPLQIALKVVGQKGEIITTPFSYVATTSAIVWENCTPVFVDIHPEYLSIDETKIEAAITPNTTAILATHVFGNPCNIEVLEAIAKKHQLKVIYDAAHCFGVNYKGTSIFEYGDISTCSFHATKIFHTGEGGAIFCKNKELKEKLYYGHNFGHISSTEFYGLGINGKLSELQAAMGLAVLPYIDKVIEARKKIIEYYDNNLNFQKLNKMKLREGTDWNYCYYSVIFKTEEALLKIMKIFSDAEIFPRRYFYPSLNNLEYVESKEMIVSEDISKRILCLPLYPSIKKEQLNLIIGLLNKNL